MVDGKWSMVDGHRRMANDGWLMVNERQKSPMTTFTITINHFFLTLYLPLPINHRTLPIR